MNTKSEELAMQEKAQIEAEKKAFFEKYPHVKRSEPIKVLNLIMKKEFAEAILKGEKTVEFRAYSQHYSDRLYDKNLMNVVAETIADEDMNDFVDFARPLREVETIHFHNYNNSWHLDVECVDNWTVAVVDEEVKDLRDTFGCTELDEMLAEMNARKEKNRPVFFYFAIGKVLDTDLK